ncbi:MAG: DUF4133 domain-containing protein [Prevotella sp.]
MAEQKEQEYQEYPVFKGLQKPLEFMGLRGRYIYWGAGTVGGAVVGFIIAYLIAGFLAGLGVAVCFLSVGMVLIMLKQKKGLHTKKEYKGIYIFAHSTKK